MVLTAEERLRRKVAAIERRHQDDEEAFDRELNEKLDVQEVLTAGLLPIHSKLRTRISGALLRDTKRRRAVAALKETAKEDDLVPVEVHGGGKCKMTIFMTREAAARERGKI